MGTPGEKKTPLTGKELLELINAANTKQVARGSLEDIADFINSFDVPAEVLMISLLQEMLTVQKEQKATNEWLRQINDKLEIILS